MAERLLFAGSIEEALQLSTEESVFLAGGTEINRLNSTIHAPVLIDIHRITELKTIKKEENTVWIGSAVTFQNVVEHPDVPAYFKEACTFMASRTKRNMATVGGNIALLRDDSYILPALLAAKATVILADLSGTRELCICEYIAARKEGLLGSALILRIGLPVNRTVFNKRYANTAMSHSVMSVSFGQDSCGKNISIGSVIKNSGIFHMTMLAEMVEKDPSVSEETVMETVNGCNGIDFKSDIYGSKEYKRYLLGATIAKMVSDAR